MTVQSVGRCAEVSSSSPLQTPQASMQPSEATTMPSTAPYRSALPEIPLTEQRVSGFFATHAAVVGAFVLVFPLGVVVAVAHLEAPCGVGAREEAKE